MKGTRLKPIVNTMLGIVLVVSLLPTMAFAEASKAIAGADSALSAGSEVRGGGSSKEVDALASSQASLAAVQAAQGDGLQDAQNPQSVQEGGAQGPQGKQESDAQESQSTQEGDAQNIPAADPQTPQINLQPAVQANSGAGAAVATTAAATGARAPLSTVVKQDADGAYRMYATLFDKDNKVVATTDPDYAVDKKYRSIEDGGRAATLDRGANVRVYFRAAFVSNDANGKGTGIQEGATYTMDLPRELVPVEQDADGNKLVDPDSPTLFFNTGNVSAKGGVYTKRDSSGPVLDADGNPTYELRISFANVDGQVDVAGDFQYSTTVSEALTPGSLVNVVYIPGGTLSFTVSPDGAPVDERGYYLSLSGGPGGPTAYYYQMQVGKHGNLADGAQNSFDYTTLTLSTGDGVGVLLDEANLDIFDSYGDGTGPGFSANVTYSTKDSDGNSEHEFITANRGNVVRNADSVTIVRFTGQNGLQVDVEFRLADAVDGAVSASGGQNSYITRTAHVSLSDGQGNPARDIEEISLFVPVLPYDDYDKVGQVTYGGTAVLDGAADADAHPAIQAEGSINAAYENFNAPSPSVSTYSTTSASQSYGYLPYQIYSYPSSNAQNYKGNYYWMEFRPGVENSGNANYYVSNASFLGGNSLSASGEAPSGATFSTGNANTFASGTAFYGTCYNWEFAGTISVAQVKGDPRFVSNGTCFTSKSATDVKLQYQMKRVFANANDGGELVVYRSAAANHFGEYAYIIVDPNTNLTAKKCAARGWSEYLECDGSAKAATWRLHFFNMPQTSFMASQFQQLGSYVSNDMGASGNGDYSDSAGLIYDEVSVGNGAYDSSALQRSRSAYQVSHESTSVLNGTWVSDDEIFWEFTVNANNWPNWNEALLYVNGGSSFSVRLGDSSLYDVDASRLSANGVYMKDASTSGGATWERVNMSSASTGLSFSQVGVNDMTERPTISSSWNDKTALFRFGLGSGVSKYCYSSSYVGDSKLVTVGFFTHVDGATPSDSEYPLTAQLVVKTGDISRLAAAGSNGGYPTSPAGAHEQYPVKISVHGSAKVPSIGKGGALVAASDAESAGYDQDKTYSTWSIYPYGFSGRYTGDGAGPLMGGLPYGGYSGDLSVVDTMASSAVLDSSGNTIEGVNLAKHTHVERMFTAGVSIYEARTGNGCGPVPYKDSSNASGWSGDSYWQKYMNGTWGVMGLGNLWDPENPGVYHRLLSTSSPNSSANPFEIYVYYSGDMSTPVRNVLAPELLAMGQNPGDDKFSKPLVVVFAGLLNARDPGGQSPIRNPISYVTSTDDAGVVSDAVAALGATGAAALSMGCRMSFTNGASCGAWKGTSASQYSAKVEKSVAAALSIKKSTPGTDRTVGSAAEGAHYSIDTQVGFSPSAYVALEDHIAGYKDSGRAADGLASVEYTAQDSADAVSALTNALRLSNLSITQTAPDGAKSTVYANGAFAQGWAGSTLLLRDDILSTEGAQPGALFSAQLVRDDGEEIAAQTMFTFAYDMSLDMDGDAGFRASGYYHGGSLGISNAATAERPYQATADRGRAAKAALLADASGVVATQQVDGATMQLLSGGTSLAGGEIDADRMVLRVWPDANVEAEFLTDEAVAKVPVKAMGSNGSSSWLAYDWTGSAGKGNVDVSLTDAVSFDMGNPYASRDDLTDQQKQDMAARLAGIAAKHVSISNARVYLTKTKPAVTNSYRGTTNLSDADMVWSKNGVIDADSAETVGGREFKLTYHQGGFDTDADTGAVSVTAPGFTLSGSALSRESYFAVLYDMGFDRDAFLAEAAAAGLIDASGNAAGTTAPPSFKLKNDVSNSSGGNASSSMGQVAVKSSVFSKSATAVDKKNGTADWRLSATLGDIVPAGGIAFSDHAQVVSENDAVRQAAEAATSIKDVRIYDNGVLVYRNGAVSDAGVQRGWAPGNVELTAQGLDLAVAIKNTDAASPLVPGKRLEVRYSTVLDKDLFVQKLDELGASSADARYGIENSGMLELGSQKLADSEKRDFEPDVPISAQKISKGNPSDGAATASVGFNATAKTGAAARTAFTLTDIPQLTSNTASAQAVGASLAVSSLDVTVTGVDGASSTYSAADILAGAVSGATLATPDGVAFELGRPGAYSWKLTFDRLPKETTVSVDYALSVNRDVYFAAGGDTGVRVSLRNVFNAASADGAAVGDYSYDYVKVLPDIAKRGNVLDQKTSNGNPVVRWTFDVNLNTLFDTAQLAQLQYAQVKDKLSNILKADVASVSVYDFKMGVDSSQFSGEPLDASEYEVSLDADTNTLAVKIKNPAQHPSVRIILDTECMGSTDSLSNSADLVVDGKLVGGSKADVREDIVAVAQYGTVTSVAAPTWTPRAVKTVDGAAPGAALAGRFVFDVAEVTETGEPIDGGYRAQAACDTDGNIVFDTVVYKHDPVAGTHFYKVTEVANDADAAYGYDDATYIVKVVVSKADGAYTVEQQITEPGDADEVTFDNVTRSYGLSVSKTDVQGNPLAGAVFALDVARDGQTFADGETAHVELSGEGVSRYEAAGLLVGDEYVLSETQAPAGYLTLDPLRLTVSESGRLEAVGSVPAGWSIDGAAFAVTAADEKTPDTPVNPDTPENPGNPSVPDNPATPNVPAATRDEEGSSADSLAVTGDAPLVPGAFVAAALFASLLGAVALRRRSC